jgi:CubicO group peptidase (beta-lactamase class C family)
MRSSLLRSSLALVLFATGANAQTSTPLVIGRTSDRTIAAGQSHTYTATLAANRFVAGEAVQDGIDIDVKVIGPQGDTIVSFDSPNGPKGPEPFQFKTTTGGTYRIVVAPLKEATGSGRYTLTLARNLAAATTPAGKVDQLLASVRATDPGVVAAVVRDGRIVYQNGWGLANLTHGVPFKVDTRTNIGSTSKQFTAFAILLLAEQKKLSLDDDVRKHIPELKDFGQPVTIRHLLTHTSGYREFLNALALTGRRIDMGDYIDRAEVVELIKRQPTLQNAPGAEFNYNNSGFSLLSTIVERAGGKPFPEWMQENVFKPLGMSNTLVRATPGQVIANSSQGYVAAPGGYREAQDIGGSMGAGGIYTTVGDLAKWIQNFHTQKVGPRGFFEQMTTRNVLTKGDTSAYGLGLFVDKWQGLKRVHHGGADIAHRSALVYFPELDAGVIVQSNNASFSSDRYAAQIAEIFFADRINKAPATPVAAGPFDPARFDTTKFDAYAGRYELVEAKGFILSFTRRGNKLFTQATGQPEIELNPTSDTTFTITRVNALITFRREAGKWTLLLNQNGLHPAVRIEEVVAAPAKPELKQYAGRYFSEELETFVDIAHEGDSLVVRSRRGLPVKLQHLRGEEFAGGFPIANVTFERNAQGVITGFRAGNGRTRDVVFKKQD